ncbi:MAG TPA: DUF2490 domain-containing protein [Flavisolibacter sp.]|nr:DUF2490 domain-containing protein [Flavisolibacter sp.]
MKKIILILFLSFNISAFAQNDRLSDYNNINWIQTINTFHINKKWSLHLEYQWRRIDGLKNWQQSILRTGATYKLNENASVHAGYGWIETFPYGDYPIASAGTFPEHRLYEQLNLKQVLQKFTLTHRFRVEQRWLGKVKPGTTEDKREIEKWNYLNRFRYQFRVQRSLWKHEEKELYLAGADELLIGAGKNAGVNIFDQNRIFLMAGFTLNKHVSLEAGYLNQTLMQGTRINGKTIMQRNNGLMMSCYTNF